MATSAKPSGTGTQTQVITINNLVKNWNTMTQNQQANNYVKYKNRLNNKLTQEQKNKVIKYINSKKEQNKTVKPFTGIGTRISNTNRTTLKQQFLSTYLTFTYEMGPEMEKKIFWRYVLLLLYLYNQIKGGSNTLVEQNYTNTNTMSGVVSEEQQKKWANVFMGLLKNMDNKVNNQIFSSLKNNIFKNIK
jgi:hypothetical protein